jgi:hypothetical protein
MKKLLLSTLLLLLTLSVYSQTVPNTPYELYKYNERLGGYVIKYDGMSGKYVKTEDFSPTEIIWNSIPNEVRSNLPTSEDLKAIAILYNRGNNVNLKKARYWGNDGDFFSYACQLDVENGRVIDETIFGSDPNKAAAFVRLVYDFQND